MFSAQSGRMALLWLVAFATNAITLAQEPAAYFRMVREIEMRALGVSNPASLAFSPAAKALLVVASRDPAQPPDGAVNIVGITLIEDPAGSVNVSAAIADPINMTFDGPANRLLLFETPPGGASKLAAIQLRPDGLPNPAAITRFDARQYGLQNSRGMTIDPVSGRLFILDYAACRIIRITPGRDHSFDGEAALRDGRISQVDLKSTGIDNLQGLAFNPNNGHLYILSRFKQRLYELTASGQVVAMRDLSNSDDFKLADPQGMAFAPSGDLTDDPALMSLYIADSGRKDGKPGHGRIIELSFTEPVAVTSTLQATLVQTTSTAVWSPSSPDPMGMAYIPTLNRFLVSDSEVEEMDIFAGVNVFDATLQGDLVDAFSTIPFSKEPTGVAFNPNNQHLFISDDDADEVFEINPGTDGQYFTADDIRTSFDTKSINNMDAEDVAYGNGNLYLADGVNSEVWEIRPGANGRFDGPPPKGDDVASHFDTNALGIADPEAVEFNSSTGTLYITGHSAKQVIETTTTGTLLNVIDITFLKAKNPSGLAYAPSSLNPPAMDLYIAARGIDNDSNPNENDGKIYEVFIGGAPPPVPSIFISNVTVTEGNSGTVNASFTVSLSAASDQQITVDYTTANGTATAGNDYVAIPATQLIFPANTIVNIVTVVVNGDALDESDETFFVNLSNPTNATIADNQGQGTIIDDDIMPTISINDATVTEGNNGTVNAVFTVSLSAAISQPITVDYTTANGTATAGSDYVAIPTTQLTLPANTTSKTITVVVNGDALSEPNETFFVNLSNPTNATIADNQGEGTIINDEPQTTITLNPTADAHVESKEPTKNFGASSALHIKQASSSIKNGYFKFVVNGVTGAVQSAKLRLKVTVASNSGGSVFLVSNNYLGTSTPWTESGLNHNNAPGLSGNPLSSVGSVTVGQTVEFDVTAAVTGNNTYSFGIKNASATTVYYSSKEGSVKPELVIQVVTGAAASTAPGNEATTSLPSERLALSPNYPNPFNAQTLIEYALPEAARVRLVIYDILGQRVRRLVDEIQAAGQKRAIWDGKNEYGDEAGSGVYFYQLEVNRQKLIGKLVLQR